MLRWATAVHYFRRTTTEDTELAETEIPAGSKVTTWLVSGNRDEEVFPEPYTFDVTRTPNDHVTFGGGGEHFCLGASLARAEIKATMRQVVERLLGNRDGEGTDGAGLAGCCGGHVSYVRVGLGRFRSAF
jgi:cytochrome P450